jgi:hypothetical protein
MTANPVTWTGSFGRVLIGSPSAPQTIGLCAHNVSVERPITVTSVSITDTTDFTLTDGGPSLPACTNFKFTQSCQPLNCDPSCQLCYDAVVFQPQAGGELDTTLKWVDSVGSNPSVLTDGTGGILILPANGTQFPLNNGNPITTVDPGSASITFEGGGNRRPDSELDGDARV